MQTARTPQAGRWRLLGLTPLLFLVGCQGLSRGGNGALIGGTGGAVLGNAVAKAAGGSRTAGTVIGGALGAITGAAVGDSIDQTERQAEARGAANVINQQNAARAPSIDEVIQMSRSGVQEQNIINQIHSTRAVYQLTSNDVIRMQQNFVPDRVISAMQGTSAVAPARVYQAAPVYVERAPAVYVAPPRPVGVGFHYHSR
jgi:hypothetical protein